MTNIRSAVQPGSELDGERRRGDNTPQPVRSLRDWLDHLAARDRLAVVKPGLGLRFELAAVAKRLDGLRATLFPRPDGHAIPVVSGLVSDRGWMAEAMGVEPGEVLTRFQDAALNRSLAGRRRNPPRRRRWCIGRWISRASFRFRSTTSTTAGPTSPPG